MIRAVIKKGKIQPLDALPNDWQEGQELLVESTDSALQDDDRWLSELNAAASRIPDRVHDEMAAVLTQHEKESKELVRREMEEST
jgi:hypothetical protein